MNEERRRRVTKLFNSLAASAASSTASEARAAASQLESIRDRHDSRGNDAPKVLGSATIKAFMRVFERKPLSAAKIRRQYPLEFVDEVPHHQLKEDIAAEAARRNLQISTEPKNEERFSALLATSLHLAHMVCQTKDQVEALKNSDISDEQKQQIEEISKRLDRMGRLAVQQGGLAHNARKPIRQKIHQILDAIPGYTIDLCEEREKKGDFEYVLNADQRKFFQRYQEESQRRQAEARQQQYNGFQNGRGYRGHRSNRRRGNYNNDDNYYYDNC